MSTFGLWFWCFLSRRCHNWWLDIICILNFAGSSSFAFLSALALFRLLLFFLTLVLSLSSFPWLFSTVKRSKRLFVVSWLALFAKVAVWKLRIIVGQAHTDIVLPCRTLVAADHGTLVVLVFHDISADAADNGVFFVVILGSFLRGLGSPNFAALFGSWLWFLAVFRMLAFGGSSGSPHRFIWKIR